MKRYLLPFLAAAFAAPAAAQVAPPTLQLPADAPVVTLQVTERVERAPDLAQISAGVTSLAATANEALAETARKMNIVVGRARTSGIADRDIQTSGITVEPSYSYPARGPQGDVPPRIVGYRASNNVQLRVRDLPNLGKLIDALVTAGANNVSGPFFALEDPSALLAGARDRAMAEADRQAEAYARRAGARRARLLSVTDGVAHMGRHYDMMAFNVQQSGAVAMTASPVSPGQVTSQVNLIVTYAMER